MKRIWFTQQKQFDYMPLRAGLELITERELLLYSHENGFCDKGNSLCPKIYTTRTRPLSGEYYVVEGNRFKAQSIGPKIEFRVDKVWKLDLFYETAPVKNKNKFAELDMGIKGTTFEGLKDELLKIYKKATIDTPFYINKMDQIRQKRSENGGKKEARNIFEEAKDYEVEISTSQGAEEEGVFHG